MLSIQFQNLTNDKVSANDMRIDESTMLHYLIKNGIIDEDAVRAEYEQMKNSTSNY